MTRVLFYVQSLLGVGHLKRASLISRAMVDAGLDVAVVLGGPPDTKDNFEGCARIHLPPVRASDPAFTTLIDEDGGPIDDAWRDRRAARLLSEASSLRPDVLLLEMFPFGRRQFRFELIPLIKAVRENRPPTKIVSSLRDVLVRKSNPERKAWSIKIASELFDAILVHGDPDFIPLEMSFPEATHISDKLMYTGYVADRTDIAAEAALREDGRGEVIVSVGGGAVGEPLLRTALAARPLSRLSDVPWRLIAGVNCPDSVYDDLAWNAPPGVIVERWRTDLNLLLHHCQLSISQGGYNTLMDLMAARARAVVVPFASESETEQSERARILATRGAIHLLEADALTPHALASAVDAALSAQPWSLDLKCDGARQTAQIITELCSTA
ncbi:MAG: glycosyl transferase family 28 [Hyphomicrobiales bacterium]|nr:glycosyl transferase family 28 [Hyphomicrobiales bacterium]